MKPLELTWIDVVLLFACGWIISWLSRGIEPLGLRLLVVLGAVAFVIIARRIAQRWL